MNLDELQSVQSRERQIDSLQQLHDSFYEEVGRFIRQLREEREHVAANADDPFDSPDVRRLSDEISTAEQTVEAIYERRIGKLVKQASLEAAGMAADVDGLTKEEQAAFDRLVSTIEENRAYVLDDVLASDRSSTADATDEPPSDSSVTPADGSDSDRDRAPDEASDRSDADTGSAPPIAEETNQTDAQPTSSPESDSAQRAGDGTATVSVADVMGDGGETVTQRPDQATPPDPTRHEEAIAAGSVRDEPSETVSQQERDVADADLQSSDGVTTATSDHSQIDRVTIRITRDVGEILCVDGRAYELSESDIVTLPETNVGPLLEHDAAVRLE